MIPATAAALVVVAIVSASRAFGGRGAAEPSEVPARRTPSPVASGLGPRAATAIACVGGVAVGAALAGPIGAVIVGLGGALIPTLVRRRRAMKRSAVIEQQLLDVVVSLAATLRAGRSLEQGIGVAADEIADPVGASLHALIDHVALGTPLDGAIEAWARDLDSEESRLIGGVLALHRRTGGGLAGPLDELAVTLRSRRAAARELRSLTAQARLSAGILGLLPIGFFLFLATVSRHDIESALATPAGAAAVVVGVVLQGSAFVWIRSLLRPAVT